MTCCDLSAAAVYSCSRRPSILYLLSTCSRSHCVHVPRQLRLIIRILSLHVPTATGGFSPASVPSVHRINPLLHLKKNYPEPHTAERNHGFPPFICPFDTLYKINHRTKKAFSACAELHRVRVPLALNYH